jgi:hypothetical protein
VIQLRDQISQIHWSIYFHRKMLLSGFLDNSNGACWKGDVKEFLLDCSKLEILGQKAK